MFESTVANMHKIEKFILSDIIIRGAKLPKSNAVFNKTLYNGDTRKRKLNPLSARIFTILDLEGRVLQGSMSRGSRAS